jgi:hypothetical protein
METADPRAELIRKWSIESPGLMAEAGFTTETEMTTGMEIHHLDAFGEAKKVHAKAIANYNKKLAKKNKGHQGGMTSIQRELLKLAFPNGHTHGESTHKKKKRVNPYKNPSYTPTTLTAALEEHTATYRTILTKIYAPSQIVIPEAIKAAALNAWAQIKSYKSGNATLNDVVAALQGMYNATGLHSKNDKFNTIRTPQGQLTRVDGESYVVDKFLTILVKYIQKFVKDPKVREAHNFKQVKALGRKLKKTKRHMRQIETALHHKTTHQAP